MAKEEMKYTRYEKSRIISTRALQIAMGAPILIKREKDELNPIDIARKEFTEGVVPITIKKD